MQFRKRRGAVPPPLRHTGDGHHHAASAPELYLVTFDMMLKGAKFKRRGQMVRQYAVIQGGAVRLVTSGDTVEREIYEALIAAGVIAGPAAKSPPETKAE